ncbi:MAG: NUDIX domain-containing protein [Pseudomonadota bacterium]
MDEAHQSESVSTQSPDGVFDDDDETGLAPAIPAATLVIFHEDENGSAPPRILMVRRAATMAFAAGAAVFPGGRVDDDDHELGAMLADSHGMELPDAAARVAAIRETLEETGLAVGLAHDGDSRQLASMRRALLEEMPFSKAIEHYGARLMLDALTPFSRWRPNFAHSRVFDTRFYLARLTGPLPDHDVVLAENSDLFWLSASDAVEQAAAGALHMIFPTRRNLERLAQYSNFAEAHESTRFYPSRRITPFIVERDGTQHLCIRDDCGYPVTSEILGSVMRD